MLLNQYFLGAFILQGLSPGPATPVQLNAVRVPGSKTKSKKKVGSSPSKTHSHSPSTDGVETVPPIDEQDIFSPSRNHINKNSMNKLSDAFDSTISSAVDVRETEGLEGIHNTHHLS